jgi:hypothetical protein
MVAGGPRERFLQHDIRDRRVRKGMLKEGVLVMLVLALERGDLLRVRSVLS